MKRCFIFWLCATLLMLAAPHAIAQATLHVSQTSSNPAPPYATWDTAAHTIQEAVDAASDGDTVLAAEGEYVLADQVTINKPIVLRSVMGAGQTILDGQWNTRCLWISNSFAVVDGFTMTQGREQDGGNLAGGVVMMGGVLTNCIVKRPASPFSEGRLVHCSNGGLITGCYIGENRAFADKGAGVYLMHSELKNSTISEINGVGYTYGAAVDGAAVYAVSSTVSGCVITNNWARRAGGGVYLDGCEMDRCIVVGNTAGVYLMTPGWGGGIFATNSVIRNSLIAANHAANGFDPETDTDGRLPGFGGGVYLSGGSVLNCTVTGNRTDAAVAEPPGGGGIFVVSGNVRNSIVYFNSAPTNANWHNGGGSFDHSCATPVPAGVGNFVDDPQFVDWTNSNYRLVTTSPCVDAGANEDWMSGAADLAGNPRIHNQTVDLGAWENTTTSSTNTPSPSMRFSQPQASNGILRSIISGLPGQGSIVVQKSNDLIEWQSTQTNPITGGTFELVEPIGPGSRQFFRALIRH